MRTYFQQQPEALHEAAIIDGANDLQILARIVIPLAKPILATLVGHKRLSKERLRVGGDVGRGERRTHIPGSDVPECQERVGAETLRGSHVRNTLGSVAGLHLQPTEPRGRAR
jgi:hypothetical protein